MRTNSFIGVSVPQKGQLLGSLTPGGGLRLARNEMSRPRYRNRRFSLIRGLIIRSHVVVVNIVSIISIVMMIIYYMSVYEDAESERGSAVKNSPIRAMIFTLLLLSSFDALPDAV